MGEFNLVFNPQYFLMLKPPLWYLTNLTSCQNIWSTMTSKPCHRKQRLYQEMPSVNQQEASHHLRLHLILLFFLYSGTQRKVHKIYIIVSYPITKLIAFCFHSRHPEQLRFWTTIFNDIIEVQLYFCLPLHISRGIIPPLSDVIDTLLGNREPCDCFKSENTDLNFP